MAGCIIPQGVESHRYRSLRYAISEVDQVLTQLYQLYLQHPSRLYDELFNIPPTIQEMVCKRRMPVQLRLVNRLIGRV